MSNKYLSSLWLRIAAKLLLWQAVLLALAWLVFSRMGRGRFSDILFIAGILEIVVGGFSIREYQSNISAIFLEREWVKSQETRSGRSPMLEHIAQREGFSLRLLASGVLTVLIYFVLLSFNL